MALYVVMGPGVIATIMGFELHGQISSDYTQLRCVSLLLHP